MFYGAHKYRRYIEDGVSVTAKRKSSVHNSLQKFFESQCFERHCSWYFQEVHCM